MELVQIIIMHHLSEEHKGSNAAKELSALLGAERRLHEASILATTHLSFNQLVLMFP